MSNEVAELEKEVLELTKILEEKNKFRNELQEEVKKAEAEDTDMKLMEEMFLMNREEIDGWAAVLQDKNAEIKRLHSVIQSKIETEEMLEKHLKELDEEIRKESYT